MTQTGASPGWYRSESAGTGPWEPVGDHLELIGSITVSCGHIELNAALIAAYLIDPQGDVGRAVVAGESFARICALIRRVSPKRITDQAQSDEIERAVTAAGKVMKRRNDLMHSTWMVSGGSATVLVKGEAVDWSRDELEEQARGAHQVAVLTGSCWMNLVTMYGHLDELVVATDALIAAKVDTDEGMDP